MYKQKAEMPFKGTPSGIDPCLDSQTKPQTPFNMLARTDTHTYTHTVYMYIYISVYIYIIKKKSGPSS